MLDRYRVLAALIPIRISNHLGDPEPAYLDGRVTAYSDARQLPAADTAASLSPWHGSTSATCQAVPVSQVCTHARIGAHRLGAGAPPNDTDGGCPDPHCTPGSGREKSVQGLSEIVSRRVGVVLPGLKQECHPKSPQIATHDSLLRVSPSLIALGCTSLRNRQQVCDHLP